MAILSPENAYYNKDMAITVIKSAFIEQKNWQGSILSSVITQVCFYCGLN